MEVHQSTKKPSAPSNNLLAPGFRFHPTDEELVRYYLRRKVCGKGFRVDAISDIDIYKAEPWDLPSMSRLKSRDMEWYFFSWLDKKYGNGSRTNRATEKGYWKTTGKDRAVYHRSQIVGMKKTLVYHEGRAPKGLRSNWVMHEYRLIDQELARAGIVQDAFVLCRIFQKSGPGPKNGERYGAPLVEEEWENDDLESILKDEGPEEVDFDVNDDIYLDGDDLEQILGSDVPPETAPPLSNFPHADGSYDEETTEPINDTQNFVVSKNEQNCELEQPDYKNYCDMPQNCELEQPDYKNYCDMPQNCELEQPDYKTYYDMLNQFDEEVRAVKHEYIGESSKSGNIEELDYLPAEPFIDASDDLKYNNGGFLEANDLSNPVITDTSFDMLDDHFMYFDANTDNTEFLACDLEAMLGSEGDLASDHSLVPQNELNEKALEKTTLPGGQFTGNAKNDMALPSAKQELANCKSDFQYPYFKQASQMLGSITAPPAFASEFPSKNAILRLNSAAQSSMHVTAGMIQVRNMNMDRYGTNHSYGKQENVNIILSFGFARHDDGSTRLDSSVSIMPGKNGWVCFMLLCFLVLSISFKLCALIKLSLLNLVHVF